MKKSKAIELLAKGEIQIYVDVKKPKRLESILKKAFPEDTTIVNVSNINIKGKYFFNGYSWWSKKLWFFNGREKERTKTINLSEIKKDKQSASISAEKMAKNLIDTFRIVLMSEDTQCGNEILCTEIAKKNAKIQAYDMIEESKLTKNKVRELYWILVMNKIEEYVS